MHGGARREADGLADLPDARRVAAVADLGVDELEDLTLAGGQIGHSSDGTTIVRSGQTPVRNFLPEPLDPNGRSCDAANVRSVRERPAGAESECQHPRGSLPIAGHTPVVACSGASDPGARPEIEHGRHHDHDPGHGPARPTTLPRRTAVAAGGSRAATRATYWRRRLVVVAARGGAGARDGAGGCRARGLTLATPERRPAGVAPRSPAVTRWCGPATRCGRSRSRLAPGADPRSGRRRARPRPATAPSLVPGETIEWDG